MKNSMAEKSGRTWLIIEASISYLRINPVLITRWARIILEYPLGMPQRANRSIMAETHSRRNLLKILTPATLLLLALALPVLAEEKAPEPQRLFHIERNTNANIVVYDALFEEDGVLMKKDPIDVYWVRLAEEGQRKGLSRIERRMAYGYKEKEREGAVLTIEMRADIGRLITVLPDEEGYRAQIEIEGRTAWLEKVFIHATEGGVLPSVDYIELHGAFTETGEPAFEKFEP
jgi:hypothetical protein